MYEYGTQEWLDRLTDRLHRLADESDWCQDFDRTAERYGIAPRHYAVTAEVCVDVDLHIPGDKDSAMAKAKDLLTGTDFEVQWAEEGRDWITSNPTTSVYATLIVSTSVDIADAFEWESDVITSALDEVSEVLPKSTPELPIYTSGHIVSADRRTLTSRD